MPLRILSLATLVFMLFANLTQAWAAPSADAGDARFFSQTGFRIDNDQFWDYFQHRGGIANFGYPVSRTFTLQGATVQIFQRRVIELTNGGVGQLNLLDNSLLPYTSFNYATFPASDPNFTKNAPVPSSPTYGTGILNWIRSVAPNNINGMPVNFYNTFANTVSMAVAYPNGGGNQGLLNGIDLEMWGAPISAPAGDPHNSNFIYQRFQRGIMHYDNTTHTTQGVLLGDYFKSILTGANLPPDLANEAQSSPYFKQYNTGAANSVNNSGTLPNTNMSNAFVAEQPVTSGPAPAGPVASPAGTSGFRYGFQAQFLEGNLPPIVSAIKGAGFGWAKQQVRWTDMEPANGQYNWGGLDSAVNAANAAGIKMLFSVAAAPAWAAAPGSDYPKNPQDFANFMNALATHYKGRVAAYEIWNEENFAREVGPGNINPGNYVQLLQAVYPVVKAADPNAIVLTGAPTPTGVNDPNIAERDITYLTQMYQYQGGIVKKYFDALGAHNEPYWNAPNQTVTTATNTSYANDPSFFFRQVEDYRNLMVQMGDGNKQIWETEIGYDANPLAPAGYNGWTVSDQQQATYLVQLFQYARANYPWMGAIFVWNLNFQDVGLPQSDEKYGFGVLGPNYTPRPAYSALAAMPKT